MNNTKAEQKNVHIWSNDLCKIVTYAFEVKRTHGHNPFLYITCISIEPPSWNSNLIMSNYKIALFLCVPGSRCDEAWRRAGLVQGPHSRLWPGGQVSSCPPQRSLSYCPQRTAKQQPSHTETEKKSAVITHMYIHSSQLTVLDDIFMQTPPPPPLKCIQ